MRREAGKATSEQWNRLWIPCRPARNFVGRISELRVRQSGSDVDLSPQSPSLGYSARPCLEIRSNGGLGGCSWQDSSIRKRVLHKTRIRVQS